MLHELTIENLALIESLTLRPGAGFTVLTGETGAGKSIIIDALNAVLGERVGSDAIRGGEKTARVEAVFDAADCPRALQALDEAGLRDGDETLVILSREVSSGRSSYRINRRPSTLSVLQDIGRHLVDIHGQHEHQTLFHEENHLAFLDAFGGAEHLELRARYAEAFGRYTAALEALRQLRMDERERAQRQDMLRFQVREIEDARVEASEEEVLAAEKARLQHAEKLREALTRARDLLDGDAEGAPAALAATQDAEHHVRSVARFAPDLEPLAAELAVAAVSLQETARSLRQMLDGLDADPGRLEKIETRLADLSTLKRKYGDSIADVLAFLDRARAELDELENLESREEQLRAEADEARRRAGVLADQLSAGRAKLSGQLAKAVTRDLKGLGMDAPRLELELSREEHPDGVLSADGKRYRATARGIDNARFLFSANAGEALRPLSKVASGGELSRLMLVLKSTCTRGAEIPTIVFDEVDAGIGGRVAHAVGEKLVGLSAGAQVLCVTHLPQIARLADTHIHVSKAVRSGRTVVSAALLDETERVAELARMLGGAETDDAARGHAEKMLEEAKGVREKLGANQRAG